MKGGYKYKNRSPRSPGMFGLKKRQIITKTKTKSKKTRTKKTKPVKRFSDLFRKKTRRYKTKKTKK